MSNIEVFSQNIEIYQRPNYHIYYQFSITYKYPNIYTWFISHHHMVSLVWPVISRGSFTSILRFSL